MTHLPTADLRCRAHTVRLALTGEHRFQLAKLSTLSANAWAWISITVAREWPLVKVHALEIIRAVRSRRFVPSTLVARDAQRRCAFGPRLPMSQYLD